MVPSFQIRLGWKLTGLFCKWIHTDSDWQSRFSDGGHDVISDTKVLSYVWPDCIRRLQASNSVYSSWSIVLHSFLFMSVFGPGTGRLLFMLCWRSHIATEWCCCSSCWGDTFFKAYGSNVSNDIAVKFFKYIIMQVKSCQAAKTSVNRTMLHKKAELPQRWPRDAPYIWVPWKFSGVPDYAHRNFSPHFNGLLFRSILWTRVQNLKFVALPFLR